MQRPAGAVRRLTLQYEPAMHGVGEEDPKGQYEPMGQTTCVDELDPEGQ
jgi:hypothetical protein